MSVAFFAAYAAYAVSRQVTYLTAGYDLGIFDQAVRDYAHFRAPIVALKGEHYNIFADHFHPIIALIAPLYWIWDSPDVLLIVQAALVAASIPFVHAFAARRIGANAALVVAFAYAAGWAIQAMIDFDFHEIAFALPLLAAALDALDRKDDRTLLITCGLLLLVREDMGAVLVMVGILRALQGGRTRRRAGYWLIGAGVAGYVVATKVIIPAFAPDEGFAYWTFDALGPNLPRAVLSIIEHPVHAVRLFFTPSVKAQTLGYLFVPLALTPLRSRYLLVAVPLLAERFFNSRDHLWTTHFHYNALVWLVLVIAMVDGCQRLGVWPRARLRALMLVFLAVVPFAMLQWDHVTPPVFRRMIDGSAWRQTPHSLDQQAAVAQIPRDVCVSVDDRLAPQLLNRDRVTLPTLSTPKTDFYVLDMSQAEVGYPLPSPQYVLGLAQRDGYRTVFSQGPMLVLRSPDYAGPSAECRP